MCQTNSRHKNEDSMGYVRNFPQKSKTSTGYVRETPLIKMKLAWDVEEKLPRQK